MLPVWLGHVRFHWHPPGQKTPKLLIWAKESFGTHQQSRSEPSASNPVFWCKTGWNLRSTLMFHELLSDAQLFDQCTIAFQICLL